MNRRNFLIGSAVTLIGIGSFSVYWPNRWNYIVVHHSAGNFGTIEFLQQVHRTRQKGDPVDAIPYHYVIGNGNGLKMGQVASDWRKEYHIWGAHVSNRNRDRNFRGIGICLIGNFDKHQVPERQYQVLVQLSKMLKAEYFIQISNVSGHGYTPGEKTKCPGKYFPMERFLSDVG